MIVMDVEGNELRALQGARTTILTYKPLLAVAAYHKKDDLPLLVQYLKQLVPDYRFYFRVHKPMAMTPCSMPRPEGNAHCSFASKSGSYQFEGLNFITGKSNESSVLHPCVFKKTD